MLEFRSVTKKFGGTTAIHDVSFKIEEGEFVLIIGPSGAGKTTLLRLLLREFLPTSGEIFFDGKEIHKLKRRDIPLLRRQIGAVFQDFKLIPTQTIRENIELALAVKGVNKNEWEERVKHVGRLVGLYDKLPLFPSQLSGGELQRATIARALVINPNIIFADEPTGNLDWDTAEGIIKLLEEVNKEGKTVIVTTHNKEIIKSHKKRVLEMKSGELIKDTKKHE